MVVNITCSGTPFQIGQHHGSKCKKEVHGSIVFYSAYFLKNAKLDWPAAKAVAERFVPSLNSNCRHLVEEMKGIADGAGVEFLDIVALNVRTEISMGLLSDGCTALYCQESGVLAQNWDWEVPQGENIVVMHVIQRDMPSLITVTEAGIVAKVGLNSSGVGATLNAIRARGVDYSYLPVHVALRLVLESTSRAEAVTLLTKTGVASACHIAVADGDGGVSGLECSFAEIQTLSVDEDGFYTHTNHYLVEHSGSKEAVLLPDSKLRLQRVNYLLRHAGMRKDTGGAMDQVEKILEDEDNYPTAINRAVSDQSASATLFGIVMDLKDKTARVRIGRPTEAIDSLKLAFNPKDVGSRGYQCVCM